MDDQEVLNLAADRLIKVYGESENTEYIRRLRAIAHTIPEGQNTDFAETLSAAINRIASTIGQDQSHPCEMPGCKDTSQYDDEPYCFAHSPDEGSHVEGYSWSAGVRYMLDENKRLTTS